jgi:hypothetical protein
MKRLCNLALERRVPLVRRQCSQALLTLLYVLATILISIADEDMLDLHGRLLGPLQPLCPTLQVRQQLVQSRVQQPERHRLGRRPSAGWLLAQLRPQRRRLLQLPLLLSGRRVLPLLRLLLRTLPQLP